MAFIEGIVTPEELEELEGHDIDKTWTDEDGDLWVRLFVDSNVSELLWPGICPGCGKAIPDDAHFYESQNSEGFVLLRRITRCPHCPTVYAEELLTTNLEARI
jgi:hypothetical protein